MAVELKVSGTYKTEYVSGEELDLTGMELQVMYNIGDPRTLTLEDVTVTGYDKEKLGEQELVIAYGGLTASITVTVKAPDGTTVTVTVSILGDTAHGEDETHTLSNGGLTAWVAAKNYTVDANYTVWDLLQQVFEENGITCIADDDNQYDTIYIKSVTYKGTTLKEFTNGNNSGWMYTLNGTHPVLGVAQQHMETGDVVILHYTDDYTKEEDTIREQQMVSEVSKLISAIPSVDNLTVNDQKAIWEARDAYEDLNEAQREALGEEMLKALEAAEAKMAELTHVCSWDAGTVTKAATCTATGIKTYKCSCGATKTETIPAAGHKFSSWTTASEATVLAEEVQQRTCSVCKFTATKTIENSKLPQVLEVPGNLSSFSIKKGKTVKFILTMAKGDSISSVKSSKNNKLKVAAVDKKAGKITLKAVKTGTYELTIKLASGKTRKYKVKVVGGTVKTTSLTVKDTSGKKVSSVTLKAKGTYTLKSEVKPFTTTQKLTYKSSNKKIAKVSSSGKITAVAPGKTTITVTSGSKKKKITVTVQGITNVKSSVTVKKNKTLTLKPKTYGISGKVTYTSSNTKVATVTSKGKIKGSSKGTAKITIKAGTFTKTVTVKVK